MNAEKITYSTYREYLYKIQEESRIVVKNNFTPEPHNNLVLGWIYDLYTKMMAAGELSSDPFARTKLYELRDTHKDKFPHSYGR
ncbi:MAG: hypothetical protein ABIO02_04930 [Patescibacteria group bacterium]